MNARVLQGLPAHPGCVGSLLSRTCTVHLVSHLYRFEDLGDDLTCLDPEALFEENSSRNKHSVLALEVTAADGFAEYAQVFKEKAGQVEKKGCKV